MSNYNKINTLRITQSLTLRCIVVFLYRTFKIKPALVLHGTHYNESDLDTESLYNPYAGYLLLDKHLRHKWEVGCHRPEF